MTENQFLKTTQPLHRCLLHDLSEGSRLDKLEAEALLDHNSRLRIEGPDEEKKAEENKSGNSKDLDDVGPITQSSPEIHSS